MKTSFVLCVCFIIVFGVSASGQQGVSWSDDPAEWPQIKEAQGKVSKGTIDFDDDPPYDGAQGFSGPLTSEGAGPVSPGVVLDNVVIDSVGGRNFPTNLTAFGPHDTWMNPSNGIVAGYFSDSLQIELTEPNHTMVMLNHWNIVGSLTHDVSFYDKQNKLIETIPGIAAPEEGHPVLYWTEDRDVTISRIVLHDPGGGAEGVMEMGFWVPEPASLLLLTFGGLVALPASRRKWRHLRERVT